MADGEHPLAFQGRQSLGGPPRGRGELAEPRQLAGQGFVLRGHRTTPSFCANVYYSSIGHLLVRLAPPGLQNPLNNAASSVPSPIEGRQMSSGVISTASL